MYKLILYPFNVLVNNIWKSSYGCDDMKVNDSPIHSVCNSMMGMYYAMQFDVCVYIQTMVGMWAKAWSEDLECGVLWWASGAWSWISRDWRSY